MKRNRQEIETNLTKFSLMLEGFVLTSKDICSTEDTREVLLTEWFTVLANIKDFLESLDKPI